jgi:hypothetical protein
MRVKQTLLAAATILLAGCGGTMTETNYDAGTVSSSETVQYDSSGNAKVIDKEVDPMMPYGDSEEGIRRAEDMDLMEAPPE